MIAEGKVRKELEVWNKKYNDKKLILSDNEKKMFMVVRMSVSKIQL